MIDEVHILYILLNKNKNGVSVCVCHEALQSTPKS